MSAPDYLSLLRKKNEEKCATRELHKPQKCFTQFTQLPPGAKKADFSEAPPPANETADAVTSWGWLLHFADRELLEVYCHPEATHAAILECYPDALTAEPVPERIAPTYEVIWPDVETVSTFSDDRRTCRDCANLAGQRCLAACREEIAARQDYEPICDIPRRCEGYAPGADDPDRRHGLERWPVLIQNGAE